MRPSGHARPRRRQARRTPRSQQLGHDQHTFFFLPPCRVSYEDAKSRIVHALFLRRGGPVRTGPQNGLQNGPQNGRQNGPYRPVLEAGPSCRPPKRRRALPLQCGGEQSGQQLDRLRFLSSAERLDPRWAEPDLTVIDCLGAQRHNLAAAARRIVIVHRFSTRRQRSETSTAHPLRRIRPASTMSPFYTERRFSAPENDSPTGNPYAPFTADRPASAPCRRRVSAASANRKIPERWRLAARHPVERCQLSILLRSFRGVPVGTQSLRDRQGCHDRAVGEEANEDPAPDTRNARPHGRNRRDNRDNDPGQVQQPKPGAPPLRTRTRHHPTRPGNPP